MLLAHMNGSWAWMLDSSPEKYMQVTGETEPTWFQEAASNPTPALDADGSLVLCKPPTDKTSDKAS